MRHKPYALPQIPSLPVAFSTPAYFWSCHIEWSSLKSSSVLIPTVHLTRDYHALYPWLCTGRSINCMVRVSASSFYFQILMKHHITRENLIFWASTERVTWCISEYERVNSHKGSTLIYGKQKIRELSLLPPFHRLLKVRVHSPCHPPEQLMSTNALAKKLLVFCAATLKWSWLDPVTPLFPLYHCLTFFFLSHAELCWLSPSKLLHYRFYPFLMFFFLGNLGSDSYTFLVFWDRENYHFILFVFFDRIVHILGLRTLAF